jgi:hypothetical protein
MSWRTPVGQPVLDRPPRGRYVALSGLLLATWLGAAAVDDSADPRAEADCNRSAFGPSAFGPSPFDYLVLASMADSPQLHAMAGYRSSATQRTEPNAAAEPALKAEDWPR